MIKFIRVRGRIIPIKDKLKMKFEKVTSMDQTKINDAISSARKEKIRSGFKSFFAGPGDMTSAKKYGLAGSRLKKLSSLSSRNKSAIRKIRGVKGTILLAGAAAAYLKLRSNKEVPQTPPNAIINQYNAPME